LPPAALSREPYTGPPRGIDGPPLVGPSFPPGNLPGEMIAPGVRPDEYLALPGSTLDQQFADEFADGELFLAPPQKLSPQERFFQPRSGHLVWQ
jgi:hypothetical protein